MRVGWLILLLLSLSCCARQPQPATNGPRLRASLAAVWPAVAPPRQTAFSRDGRLIALSDASGLITIRSTQDWKPVRQLAHPGGATTVVFSRDGSKLLSAGYDGTIRFWDLRSGRRSDILGRAHGTIWTLDLSPDGSRVAAAGEDGVIRLWSLAARNTPLELRGHTRNIWEVRFSRDGRRLASGSFDNSVRLWDVPTGREIKKLAGHSQAVVGLDYSPQGALLATGADDSTIRLWRASDGAPLRSTDNGLHVDKVAFSPDGQWIASGGHARGQVGTLWHQLTGNGGLGPAVRLWRVGDGALVATLPHPDDVIYVAFSNDGRWLVTSGEDNDFRLWRLSAAR